MCEDGSNNGEKKKYALFHVTMHLFFLLIKNS